MITFNQAFGGGTASGALGGWALPILASKSITIASKGKLQIAAMGGTGSGGFTGTGGEGATGANSAPWGVKIINVAVGDVVEFVIGAGGAGQTVAGSGIAGNATLVKLNGATIMTCNPGEPGIKGAAFPLVQTAPTATVVGADYWVPGLRSGQLAAGAVAFGGAAVDVFARASGAPPARRAAAWGRRQLQRHHLHGPPGSAVLRAGHQLPGPEYGWTGWGGGQPDHTGRGLVRWWCWLDLWHQPRQGRARCRRG